MTIAPERYLRQHACTRWLDAGEKDIVVRWMKDKDREDWQQHEAIIRAEQEQILLLYTFPVGAAA